jgi:hypothetical protein
VDERITRFLLERENKDTEPTPGEMGPIVDDAKFLDALVKNVSQWKSQIRSITELDRCARF